MFGVVLDVEAALVPNVLLKPTFEKMPSRDFAQRFLAVVGDERVKIAGAVIVRRDKIVRIVIPSTHVRTGSWQTFAVPKRLQQAVLIEIDE